MERARYNEQVLARFQKVELRLIGIVSFKELIEAILEDYREAFELDIVSLSLIDADYDLRRTLMDAEVPASGFPGLILFDRDIFLTSFFGQAKQPGARRVRPRAPWHAVSRSESCGRRASPCCRSRAGDSSWGASISAACATTGSRPGMATNFIEWLAAVASVCLENVANNERLKHIGLDRCAHRRAQSALLRAAPARRSRSRAAQRLIRCRA